MSRITLVEESPVSIMYNKGEKSFANYQLIAAIIGGNHESAIEKAKKLLLSVNEDIRELTKMSVSEIQNVSGLTKAKATVLAAAIEFGRRRTLSDLRDRPSISGSRDAYNCIAPVFEDLRHEEFWMLMLNKANQVIKRIRLSSGGTAGTVVDTKILFRTGVEAGAAAMILFHNHPSGNLTPSQADLDLTRRCKKAGELLDLPILDHIIVSERGYYSFADEGNI